MGLPPKKTAKSTTVDNLATGSKGAVGAMGTSVVTTHQTLGAMQKLAKSERIKKGLRKKAAARLKAMKQNGGK